MKEGELDVLRPKAKWNWTKGDPQLAQGLVDQLNLHPIVADIMVGRGIQSVEQAQHFLQPKAEHLHDPMLLKGMPEAVARIETALREGQRIRIYGDYDADGVSSTSLMVHLLRKLGADFDYYVPHRFKEGYGLNVAAIDIAKDEGIDLIITVDNGVSAVEQIAHATSLGIDVVVTDHHEPPEQLPEACALINPKQPGCSYPYKELAGVGVAFKLAQALLKRVPLELTEFAAIGTVADLMPLVDENRVLVKLGLEHMKHSEYPGIRALLRIAGVTPEEVSSTDIGYALGPRINASGRLQSAGHAVECLIAEDIETAEQLAVQMDVLNKDRQAIVEQMTADAQKLILDEGLQDDEVLVIAGEGWNVGVVGIVAAKILEKMQRPVLVLSIDPDTGFAKGSARSIPGFDLHAALTQCEELLLHYGGHQAAAGMTLRREDLGAFRQKLCELAAVWVDDGYIPELDADLECTLEQINLELIEQLQTLAPYGMGNEAPRVVLSAAAIRELKVMGKEKQHMKLVVGLDASPDGPTLDALAFGKGQLMERISDTSRVELLGELSINEWNGRRKPQMILQDLQIKETQVFDRRGGRAPEKLREWLNILGLDDTERAVVVFSSEHKEEVEAALLIAGKTIPVWTMTSDGRMATLSSDASTWKQVKHLFLYSIPEELWKLEHALQQTEGLETVFTVFAQSRGDLGAVPSREAFKSVYGALLQAKQWKADDERFITRLGQHTRNRKEALLFIIDVFIDLGFLEQTDGHIRCVPNPAKKDLTTSPRYRAAEGLKDSEAVLLYSTSAELTAWIRSHSESVSDQRMEEFA